MGFPLSQGMLSLAYVCGAESYSPFASLYYYTTASFLKNLQVSYSENVNSAFPQHDGTGHNSWHGLSYRSFLMELIYM